MERLSDEELASWIEVYPDRGPVGRALRELQQLRAAKAADRERVEDVVQHVVSERLRGSDQFSEEGIAAFAEHVASRVACVLSVPGRVLSDRQRHTVANHMGWLRDRVAGTFDGTIHEGIADILNDLLSTRPIPPLVREIVQRELDRVPAGERHEWERTRLQECLEALP